MLVLCKPGRPPPSRVPVLPGAAARGASVKLPAIFNVIFLIALHLDLGLVVYCSMDVSFALGLFVVGPRAVIGVVVAAVQCARDVWVVLRCVWRVLYRHCLRFVLIFGVSCHLKVARFGA